MRRNTEQGSEQIGQDFVDSKGDRSTAEKAATSLQAEWRELTTFPGNLALPEIRKKQQH